MMVIGLYTSRLALGILGISDYGLFSVVGGVLAMFTFISSSLANATSRFLNVEMGKKDGDVNRVFSVNVLLHIALAGFIFVLAETIGLWYIYNMLNVAPGKQEEATAQAQVRSKKRYSAYRTVVSRHEEFSARISSPEQEDVPDDP